MSCRESASTLLANSTPFQHNEYMSHALFRFSEVDKDDAALVGMKGVLLGELNRAGFVIPDGFIVSSASYFTFLKENQLITKINHLLQTIDYREPHSLMQVASHIQRLIKEGTVNESLTHEIFRAYKLLGGTITDPTVILRPSITVDALPMLGVAGERGGIICVTGESTLLVTIKSLWASLFDAKSIFYRHEKHYDAFSVGLAVIVQNMIKADISGSLFSINVAADEKDSFVIEAIYGLQDPDTSHLIPADRYVIQKKTGEVQASEIREQLVARERVGGEIHTVRLDNAKAHKRKLTEPLLQDLVEMGKRMELHHYFPFEVTWAIKNTNLYVLMVKHITPHPETLVVNERAELSDKTQSAVGVSHTQGIATGYARVITNAHDLKKIASGEIVIMKEFSEGALTYLKKSYGVILEAEVTSPVAIQQLKTLGKPAVSHAAHLLTSFRDGSVVTINANSGEIQAGGKLLTETHKKAIVTKPPQAKLATKMLLSIAKLPHDDTFAQLSSDGIGWLNGNTLLTHMGVHPKKVIQDESQHDFSTRLAESMMKLSQSFYPRPVMYKLADLMSTEMKLLHGGKAYEPNEPNPLLGYRGGHRYLHDQSALKLELEALRIMRVEKGLTNMQLILPFVRSSQELKRIKKVLSGEHFMRSPSFKLWLSVDTPENVINIDRYLGERVDGLIIHITALTTLFTGVDPHNSEVTADFHEANSAVLQGVNYVIRRAQKHNLPVLMYGASVPYSPELLEKAVSWGITGIVTPPDALENVRKTVYNYERKLLR